MTNIANLQSDLPLIRCLHTILILFANSVLTTGCFTRWVMTEKEISRHYAEKKVKPNFTTIVNDTVQLFCAATGSDSLPPLLLVHGAPGGWFSNIGLLDDSLLQKNYHVIAVDRPGYRRSRFRKRKFRQTSIEHQAAAIYQALQLNKSGKPGVLYGNSYGAPIALKIAADHPDRFRHLVLAAGAFDPDNEKFWWFHKYARGLLVRLSMPRFINTATREKFAHEKELRKILPSWKQLNMPVTVIHGSADHIVPVDNLNFAKEQLQGKQAQFILIEGAGHLVRRSHPKLIRNLLLNAGTQPVNF